MREFEASEYENHSKEVRLELSQRSNVHLRAVSPKPLKMFGLREGEKVLLETGTTIAIRKTLTGFQALLLVPYGQQSFSLAHDIRERQLAEYNSGERPPIVDMPEPSNLVWKMRQLAKAEHDRSRVPVLEPENLARYEYDDDAELMFEEEWLAKVQQQRQDAETPGSEPPAAPTQPPSASSGEDPPPEATEAQ